LVETLLYMWQGFVAKNPGWSPIRELVTPADTYTRSVSAGKVRTASQINIVLLYSFSIRRVKFSISVKNFVDILRYTRKCDWAVTITCSFPRIPAVYNEGTSHRGGGGEKTERSRLEARGGRILSWNGV